MPAKRILVTGATGFLGQRVCQRLESDPESDVVQTSQSLGLDLRDMGRTQDFFVEKGPDYVIHCAAYTGGLQFGANRQADILRNNLLMLLSLHEACQAARVTRLVSPIANCAYPGEATLFREDEMWDGPLHDSVLAPGMVGRTMSVAAKAYRRQHDLDTVNVVLSNMFGPGDHFDPERSHALGALIRKMVDGRRTGAAEVVVWGTGKPVREWLYVDDAAEAMVRALTIDRQNGPLNIGTGRGQSIRELAELIAELAGFEGKIVYDTSRPDGAPHKTVDGSRGAAALSWEPQTDFRDAIQKTIEWFESTQTPTESVSVS